jgi:predicted site-specific integrase-resolvase
VKKLLPEKQVAQRYGVHVATLRRWDKNPKLDFPKPLYITNRRYRVESELDAFDERAKNGGKP